MCGITGFYNTKIERQDIAAVISRMVSLIRHRGPDEMAYGFNHNTAFATARLSIIDLKTGQQPMKDDNQRYWISFNGELYNYVELRDELKAKGIQFNTTSDTEVVLKSYIYWGSSAFAKFNGAYGIAIYDSFENSLILVRDKFGKKPLYYSRIDNECVFASEVKCFLAHPHMQLAFDPQQLSSICAQWTLLPNQSGYKDIAQVSPGCFIEFSQDGRFSEQSYFQYPTAPFSDSITSMAQAKEEVVDTLKRSVEIRLRSDVEVGTYLSGGIDSSITSLLAAQRAGDRLKTFGVQFANEDYDESSAQEIMSKHIGCTHHAIKIAEQDIVDNFYDALWYAEVPVFRTAFVPMYMLSKHVSSQGIKVVLTGEGADESFLGYNIFKETLVREQWHDFDNVEQKADVLKRLYPYLGQFQRNAEQQVGVFDNFAIKDPRYPNFFSHALRFNNNKYSQRLLKDKHNSLDALSELMHAEIHPDTDAMGKAQWLEFNTLLHGYLLSTQGDRMSFANGVEARLPFMDPNVVMLANRLSQDLKLPTSFNEKAILKAAFADQLPKKILCKPKQPYRAPDATAFLSSSNDNYKAFLTPDYLKGLEYLDTDFVEKFLKRIFSLEPTKISQRENQTFILLLSMSMLHHQFTHFYCRGKYEIHNIVCRFEQ